MREATGDAAMTEQIHFTDGAAYDRYMGEWSRLAGAAFLDWLGAEEGWRWLDVGCGSGAFTRMVVERCAPASVDGIDPSEEQLAFARAAARLPHVRFDVGDATAVPFAAETFDAAVMPLVIFFVPDPAKGVAEMARVVRPGGLVSAYAWDIPGGGFPYEALKAELRRFNVTVPEAPNVEAARTDVMQELWTGAGLTDVETREIGVQRVFADFDEYWTIVFGSPSFGSKLAAMPPGDLTILESRMRERLAAGADGPITCSGRANAIKGRKRSDPR
jgi:ubiquinone/menaquinone biosynthesis C-methylase UbiE